MCVCCAFVLELLRKDGLCRPTIPDQYLTRRALGQRTGYIFREDVVTTFVRLYLVFLNNLVFAVSLKPAGRNRSGLDILSMEIETRVSLNSKSKVL